MYIKTHLDLEIFLQDMFSDDLSTFIILACDDSRELCKSLAAELKKRDVYFMGGFFPSIISEGNTYCSGLTVQEIKSPYRPYLISRLDNEKLSDSIANQLPDKKEGLECVSFFDCHAKNANLFTEILHLKAGEKLEHSSGYAETNDIYSDECVFSNEGFFKDAAVFTFMDPEWNLEIKKNWIPKTSQFNVKKQRLKNIIYNPFHNSKNKIELNVVSLAA